MKRTTYSSNNLVLTVQEGSRNVGEPLGTAIVSLKIKTGANPITINTELDLAQFDALEIAEKSLGEAILDRLSCQLSAFIFKHLQDEAVELVNDIWAVRNNFDAQAREERKALEQ